MIPKKIEKNLTYLSILVIFIGTIFLNFSHHRWQRKDVVIEWDVKSYYAYLPATFIYKDLSLQFRRDNIEKFGDLIWPVETPTGKHAIVTSMGLSVMYAPFFGAAHAYCLISDKYEPDGYSMPYRFALVFSALFYVIIGLLFLRKVLKKYFNEAISALVIVAIGVGTNLLYYYSYEAAMPHAFNFSLIAIFLYQTVNFYQSPSRKKIFLAGMMAGFITLIRPTNIIILVFFFLWNIATFGEFKARIQYYLGNYLSILIMIAGFVIVWIPQFVYWYYVSGSIFYYSYGEIGGNFYFNNPQVWNILFSYKKGWFVYTPVMFLAAIGIFFLPRFRRGFFFPVFTFVVLNVYILSSWWCWWYGGAFGLRAFIDSYAIMALPLGALIRFFSFRKVRRYAIWTVVIVLIIFNVFQIQQYTNQAIHYWWMNKEAYWETFLKLRPTDRYWDLVRFPDYEKARKGIYKEIKPERKEKKDHIVPSREKVLQLIESNIRTDSVFLEKLGVVKSGTKKDSLIKLEALHIYNRDSSVYKKQLILDNLEKSIRNNDELLDKIEKKAKRKGVSMDSMITLDAIWLYENEILKD